LAGDRGGDREIQYNLALRVDAGGQHDRARCLIEARAPDDRAGFAPAHAWKASRLLAARNLATAQIRDAESHLLHAAEGAPYSIEVQENLGLFYVALGRPELAIPHLEKAAYDRSELLMTLARTLQAQDRRSAARERATAARNIYRRRAEANLDDFASRLRWVEAAVFLEDFPDAVAALRREASVGRDARYLKALSQVYTAWAEFAGRAARSDLSQRLELLEQGLALDPSNKALLARFSDLIRLGGDESVRARAALQALVAGGRATGPVHFALGLDAWMQDRRAEARLHWEEACRLDPQSPLCANNLACALAVGTDPDLTRALALINPVIALCPQELRYRETRGQILAKLERWREALPDLKGALIVYPDSPELHWTLAETYAHLDAPAIAAEHRKRAEALAPKTNPDKTSFMNNQANELSGDRR
jgi:tetratricopeptide (TPR) repeat protein